MLGGMRAQVVYSLVQLRIPDLLADDLKPQTTVQLAQALSVARPDKLFRLLLAGRSLGYLSLDRQGGWHITRAGVVLAGSHPTSIRPIPVWLSGHMAPLWDQLPESLQLPSTDGQDVIFPRVHGGLSVWEYLEANPAVQQLFGDSMAAFDAVAWFGPVHDFDWSTFKRVVDVGGNSGSFLYKVLEAHPALRGSVFDLPSVVERNSRPAWEDREEGVRNRTTLVAGNFFDASTLPKAEDGDAFVLREILHDWSDADTLAILKALRAAIGDSQASLLIIEFLPEKKDLLFGRYAIDLLMMLVFGGKERSEEEFAVLLEAAGFRVAGVTEVRAVVRVLEAVPVKVTEAGEAGTATQRSSK